ncbi:uncharacterized protein LOC111255149 isoform X2 [Varroa destructor]|uniref:Uncharacterized protein n=1 Tax=Varroa destructor TaxID=109461 RepID=A0A7M7KY14_VARDE|nr:uncharacterized protein LOC111255149 isoform X2 [Varroa destructor]
MKKLIVPPTAWELMQMEYEFNQNADLAMATDDYSRSDSYSTNLTTRISSGITELQPSVFTSRRLIEAPDDSALWSPQCRNEKGNRSSEATQDTIRVENLPSNEVKISVKILEGRKHPSASLLSRIICSLRRSCTQILIPVKWYRPVEDRA